MEALRAIVRNGRLILDVATDLPDGTEVELAVVRRDESDPELLEELEGSEADEAAGNLVDFDDGIARLGSKPLEVAERLASPEARARLATDAAISRERAKAIVDGAIIDEAFLAKRTTL